MRLDHLLNSWEGTQRQNRWQRVLVLGLLVADVVLAVAVFTRQTVVSIQPPTLVEQAEVSRSRASQPYLESWALFLAELMGNVTPGNVPFIRDALGPLLAPDVYQQVIDALEIQARQIREDRITLKFQPRQVDYEAASGHVFVTGYSYIAGPAGDEQRQTRTYEFALQIRHYRPLLTWMETYEGAARTQKVREDLARATKRSPSNDR